MIEVLPSPIKGGMPVERVPKHQMTEQFPEYSRHANRTGITSHDRDRHPLSKNIIHSTPISSTSSLRAKEIPLHLSTTGEADLSKVMRPHQPVPISTTLPRPSGSVSSMQSTIGAASDVSKVWPYQSDPRKSALISTIGEGNSRQGSWPHQPMHSTPMHSVPMHQAPRNSTTGGTSLLHSSERPSFLSTNGDAESSSPYQSAPVSAREPTKRVKKISKKKVFLPPLL